MTFTLNEIARHVGGVLKGPGDLAITGLSKIEAGAPQTLTFLANTKYAQHLENTTAAAVIVPDGIETPEDLPVIVAKDPYFAFMLAVRLFNPEKPFVVGVHETAVIAEDAIVDATAAIGPHVVVGAGCRIGSGTQILANTVIGRDVTIGDDCIIHARVSLREGCQIGHRVVIYDGSVIGADGFGFVPHQGAYHKIPQVGIVVIEDDVELGANTCIDRATMGETRIGTGVKLDNLIQVAHNCSIGPHTVIASQTGVSGSTHIGSWCRIGGQVGFAGHQKIGDKVAIMAQAGVSKSLEDGAIVGGSPAGPHRQEMRIQAAMRHLPDLNKEIKQIKAQLLRLAKPEKDEC